jgi:hypothetical protein
MTCAADDALRATRIQHYSTPRAIRRGRIAL